MSKRRELESSLNLDLDVPQTKQDQTKSLCRKTAGKRIAIRRVYAVRTGKLEATIEQCLSGLTGAQHLTAWMYSRFL